MRGERDRGSGGREDTEGPASPPRRVAASEPLGPVLLSCAALLVVFWGLHQLDLTVAAQVRSVHEPWVEWLGDAGSRLGSGGVLAALSASLLLAGWARDRPVLRRAGFHGLIAHGVAALAVQVLKHLIGRARPRLVHLEGMLTGPNLAGGLDSFPSGHASAAFAVAAVMAHHCPRLRWPAYGLAGFVIVSRVVRGSHFPTDVLAGALLGLAVGALVVNPLKQWRTSLARVPVELAPFAAGAVTLLWTAGQPPSGSEAAPWLVGAGLLAMGIGWVVRVKAIARDLGGAATGAARDGRVGSAAIAVGLAATGGSLLPVAAAALAGAGWWAGRGAAPPWRARPRRRALAEEAALALALAGTAALLRFVQGSLSSG